MFKVKVNYVKPDNLFMTIVYKINQNSKLNLISARKMSTESASNNENHEGDSGHNSALELGLFSK